VPEGFTTFEVGDPHQTNSVVWDRLPANERSRLTGQEIWSRTYEAADWRRFKSDPESYRSTFSVGLVGALRLSRIADERGTGFTIHDPGLDAHCISVMERGSARLTQPGSRSPDDTDRNAGLIFPGREATRLVTSDRNVRLQLWVPGTALRGSLEAMLERPAGNALEFSSRLAWTGGGAASLHRLVRHLFAELADPASLLARGIGARQFEDLLVQSLLLGLPHSHANALLRQKAAAPANVRRAEEFLRANAEEAVTIAEIAQAAGCSIRALQVAFRRFRNTTPMEALRHMRLEQAHAEIIRADGPLSVIEIAAKYGFANPGRFANQYKRAFGEYPSQVLRARASLLVPRTTG
jgi:AraC-like DNA-binding protein